jgi:hypothetical protein
MAINEGKEAIRAAADAGKEAFRERKTAVATAAEAGRDAYQEELNKPL